MKFNIKTVPYYLALMLVSYSVTATETMEMVDATDPKVIENMAKGIGSATLEEKKGEDPHIVGKIDGAKYGIAFFGCDSTGKNCTDIQFFAGWGGGKVSLAKINEWNHEKRFGRAYLDKDHDPRLEFDINLDHGVSKANLEDSFNYWLVVFRSFKKTYIDD